MLRTCAIRSDGDAKTLGPQMVFVTLSEFRPDEPLADLATRWKEVSNTSNTGVSPSYD